MKNVVQFKSGGDLQTLDHLRGGLKQARMETASGSHMGLPLLKLTRQGDWVYGQDAVEVEEGSLWAINPNTLEHGWICWHEGGVWKEFMAPIHMPRPAVEELPDPPSSFDKRRKIEIPGKWDAQYSVQMMCMTGEDAGQEMVYKTNSAGGVDAFDSIFSRLDQQLEKDPSKPVMVVELDTTSYTHKEYGEVFKPMLNLAGAKWISMDEPEAATEEPEPEPEEQVQEEQPTRRRRRRKSA